MGRRLMDGGDVSIKWDGDALNEAMREAAAEAVNEVAEECVQEARSNHWFRKRTGGHTGAVRIVRKATAKTGSADWGASGKRAPQALGLELEASRRGGWLRKAADQLYGKLPGTLLKRVESAKVPPAAP